MSLHNPTPSGYEAFRVYLTRLPEEQYGVELTFKQIEGIIGEQLPAEASEYKWWRFDDSEPKTPLVRACMEAGFGIGSIAGLPDRSGWVSFGRGLHRWPAVFVSSWEFGQLPVAERLRQLAIGYLASARLLCVGLGEMPSELTWPRGAVVCFCYRHAVELFLKSCILHRGPLEKCDHDISKLQKQYVRIYPQQELQFHTIYDIGLDDIEELAPGGIDVEDFERKEDQVYRYLSDKQGRSPKGMHIFAPGTWLSMIEQFEGDMKRIWTRIRESENNGGRG
ncbi:MAG: hypothetical protein J0I06_06235 [Planctomycetes bacterium]|nr:hypothetical protein [Planctomycetota bacterium]